MSAWRITLRLFALFASSLLVLAQYPENDACPGFAIPSLPYVYDGDNTNNGTDYDLLCANLTVNEAVFTLTLPMTAVVTASLCAGTSFDAQLLVLTGGNCPGNVSVACSYDDCGSGYQRGQVTFSAEPNATYYLIVSGWRYPPYGPYRLTVTAPPPNDICPGTLISSLPYSETGSTVYAHNDYPFFLGSPGDTNDVVYRLNLPECRVVTVSLCGSSFNTFLALRSDALCIGENPLENNDDFCGQQSQLTFGAAAGIDYYLIIDGIGEVGTYTLNITEVPLTNDVCPGTTISALPFHEFGGTCNAQNDYAFNCSTEDSNDVVYSLHSTRCQHVSVSLCWLNYYIHSYQTQLLVRKGGACPGNEAVTCAVDNCDNGSQSRVYFDADANTDYYIIVDGAADAGIYEISVDSWYPFNDTCPGEPIYSLPFMLGGETVCANDDYTFAGMADTSEVVYALNLFSMCEYVTASLCSPATNFDTRLQVRAGGACPGTNLVAYNDDFCGLKSQVAFYAQPSTNYYLIIGGNGQVGWYNLEVTGTQFGIWPGDICPYETIYDLPWSTGAWTACANDDYTLNGIADTNEVVYKMDLPPSVDRLVTAYLCNSDYDTRLQVRTGGTCPGDNLVAFNDDFCGTASQVTFHALPAVVYYFIVGGNHAIGGYGLNVYFVPYDPPAPIHDLVIRSSVSTNSATLDWSRSSNADGYNVYRGEALGFPLDTVHRIASISDTHYVDLNALADPFTRRYYVVTSLDAESATRQDADEPD